MRRFDLFSQAQGSPHSRDLVGIEFMAEGLLEGGAYPDSDKVVLSWLCGD